jgi:hypothetical protein
LGMNASGIITIQNSDISGVYKVIHFIYLIPCNSKLHARSRRISKTVPEDANKNL